MYDNNKKPDGGIGDYIGIAIAFAVFWPLGIILLLSKLGVFKSGSSSSRVTGDTALKSRQEKYKVMTRGRAYESIEYLASAVGISYESALRELQRMVANGEFGRGAYINYVDKTLVLPTPAQTAAPPPAQTAAPRQNAARPADTVRRPAGTAAPRPAAGPSAAEQQAKTLKNLYTPIRIALLIAGIVLTVVGVASLAETVDMIIWSGSVAGWIPDLLEGLFPLVGGLTSFIARATLKRRTVRYGRYLSVTAGRDYIPLTELARAAGVSTDKLRRDLDAMIDKGIFGPSVYVDVGEGLLILKPGARPPEKETPKAPDDSENRYQSIIKEIRQLNDEIKDAAVSERIDRMEDLASKIFRAVEENPEKLPQIKSFMSYYLPTTLKLLHSYSSFENSGAEGETVDSAKRDIERILDQLVDGFKKQLDRLYETEAMDISSDIDVLENMMKRDGITDDGSNFKQSGGQTMGGV